MIRRPRRPLLTSRFCSPLPGAGAGRAGARSRRCCSVRVRRCSASPTGRRPSAASTGARATGPAALAPYAGAIVHRRGARTYRYYISDAIGADNGQDFIRLGLIDPLAEEIPELFRLDPAYQYVPGEFGVPTGPLDPRVHYGDVPHVDEADLSHGGVGTSAKRDLWLLARTTTMRDTPGTALLVLLDTHARRGRPRGPLQQRAHHDRR